jgi:hypothetical protein
MIQGMYVIGLIIILIVIYFIIPEMTINNIEILSNFKSDFATKEGFVNIPKPVEIPIIKNIQSSEGPSLPSAPFYGISEDRPLPSIDPKNEVTSILRMRRLLERLEGFFLSDYKTLEDKVEYLEPITNAKALLPRLREEIHFLDANPGMLPTLTTKKIMEGEATLSFLERVSREVTLNEIEGYTNFRNVINKSLKRKEGFVNVNENETNNNQFRTRATVQNLINFNLRAWAEMQRLGASGTVDPIINARINAIKKIRDSMQRIIDDVQYKKITETDIPVFKEDLERAFPVLADTTQPIPKLLATSQLPPELANIIPPGTNVNEKDIQKLISTYINNILNTNSFSLKLKMDYISPNEVRIEESKTKPKLNQEFIDFSPMKTGPKMNLTFSDSTGKLINEVGVDANDNNPDKIQSKYNPSLDWKNRTKQICDQVRRRGLDPHDFGCLKDSKEVSADYSWRGHAKMVCSRLRSTPDPALPETCGCPASNWSGWNSDFSLN